LISQAVLNSLGLKALRLILRLAKEWLRRRSWQLLLFLDSLICMDERYGVKSLEELLPQDVLNCDRDFTSLSVQQKVAESIPGILPSAAVSSKSPE
jgi:hypothetical protein